MRSHVKAIKLTTSGKGGYMRALDCDCGRHLEAADDQKLFDKVQEHVSRDHHPEMQLSAEQVREMVAENAYDKKPDIWAGTDIPRGRLHTWEPEGCLQVARGLRPAKNDRSAYEGKRSKTGRR